MSEMNRTPLSDDVVESIAGGNVQVVANGVETYCYPEHNPSAHYGFSSLRALKEFVDANYDYYGEAGIFQEMVNQGIIWPM